MQMKRRRYIAAIVTAFLVAVLPCSLSAGQRDSSGRKEPVPLMTRIQNFALKNNPVSKFVRSLLVTTTNTTVEAPDTTITNEVKYVNYEGRVIRNVNITTLSPFGYSVNAPVCYSINRFQKLGNRIHYPTRTWIIRNKLLFGAGDTLNAFNVSESERLLRQSAYLREVRIDVEPVQSDTVDVNVIVQDIWAINGTVAGNPLEPNGSVSVSDINFLGFGQKFESKFWYDPDFFNQWKYSGRFTIPEIGRSYITAETHYYTEERDRTYGFSFNRPFFSTVAAWAGGFSADFRRNYFSIPVNLTESYAGYQNVQYQDAWLGYAFNPNLKNQLKERKSQVVISGRVSNTNYVDQSSYAVEMREHYPDEQMYLATVAYSFRQYYQDRFIFGFGRTEDIPEGALLSLTGGANQTYFYKRGYAGAKISYGKNHSALGYTDVSLEGGGFWRSLHSDVEQGVIAAQALYFTNMVPVKDWFIRQFIWNRLALGFNRRPGELLNVDKGEGLRVLSSERFRGTQKLTTNYEIDFFTPYKPLDFRIVGVLFADFALIGSKGDPLLNNHLLQGYGIGLRLKNERLVFNTFQVSFHYYPGMSYYGVRELWYYHTEQPYYRMPDFSAGRPYVVGF
jgi:hypothetical protein